MDGSHRLRRYRFVHSAISCKSSDSLVSDVSAGWVVSDRHTDRVFSHSVIDVASDSEDKLDDEEDTKDHN